MSWLRPFAGSTLTTVLVAFYIVAMTGFNIWKPRILVVQSFSESSREVMDLDAGMRDRLRVNRLPVSVQWYYLNSDHPDLDTMKNSDIMGITRVIRDFNPSLMILADDQANHLMAIAPELKQGRRIFFLGINQSPTSFGYTANRLITGISNVAPRQSLKELLSAIAPGRNLRITVLGSDTDLGRHLGGYFETKRFGINPISGVYYARTWQQWKAAVERSNKESDILLVTAIHGVNDTEKNRIVSPGEVVKWTEARTSKVQPIGLIAGYVPLGGSLSLFPSGFYRGSVAMRSVLQWSEPNRKQTMPKIKEDDHFNIGMRIDRLRERGISLPLIYRESARESNQLYAVESEEEENKAEE